MSLGQKLDPSLGKINSLLHKANLIGFSIYFYDTFHSIYNYLHEQNYGKISTPTSPVT